MDKMETIKSIKCEIIDMAHDAVRNSESVNVAVASQIFDMMKDASEVCKNEMEAKYYELVAKAMEESENKIPDEILRMAHDPSDMSMRMYDRRYDDRYTDAYDGMKHMNKPMRTFSEGYNLGYKQGLSENADRGYTEGYAKGMEDNQRDWREGKAGHSRMTYMSTREIHNTSNDSDKRARTNALDEYLQTLASDMSEMIDGMMPDEKVKLKQQIQMIANKIV